MATNCGAASCLGDSGYNQGETIRASGVSTAMLIKQAAAVVIAVDNANQLVDNFRRQRDIARRGWAISRQQQDHLQSVFWPREGEFLNEFSVPEAIETVEVMGRRYGGRLAAAVAGAFATRLKEAKCSAPRYCTSANTKNVQDLMMARSVALGNARVLGRSIAFAEYQARTDANYERRMQAVALGRGLMQQAASLYASAGEGLASVGQMLSSRLGNAIQAFGVYNEMRNAANTYRGSISTGGAQPFGNNLDSLQGVQGFGLSSSMQGFTNRNSSDVFADPLFAGDTTGLSADNMKPFPNMQNETQMNEAVVGNRDLIRTGMVTFPVAGITGGSVTVDMERFGLMYADDLVPKPAT